MLTDTQREAGTGKVMQFLFLGKSVTVSLFMITSIEKYVKIYI